MNNLFSAEWNTTSERHLTGMNLSAYDDAFINIGAEE